MGTIKDKLQKAIASKLAIKQALVNKGKNPSDVVSTYAGLIEELTDTSDATAAAADILKDKTAYVNGSKVTGTIPSKAAATYTPGDIAQEIAAGQYLSGKQTVAAVPTETKEVTPGASAQDVTPTSGKYLSKVSVAGDADLVSANIKAGVNIFGVDGKSSVVDTADATATAANMLSGKTAYVNGSKVTGTIDSGKFTVWNKYGVEITSTKLETTPSCAWYNTCQITKDGYFKLNRGGMTEYMGGFGYVDSERDNVKRIYKKSWQLSGDYLYYLWEMSDKFEHEGVVFSEDSEEYPINGFKYPYPDSPITEAYKLLVPATKPATT